MRYNEIIKESTGDEPYVVIINHGRGVQATWPSSEAPGVYTQAEAQAIVDAEEARQNPFNGGAKGHAAWHAQPLKDALNFIGRGNACYNKVQDLQMRLEDNDF